MQIFLPQVRKAEISFSRANLLTTPLGNKSLRKVDQRSDQHAAEIMILRAALYHTLSQKINVLLNASKQKKKVSLATALLPVAWRVDWELHTIPWLKTVTLLFPQLPQQRLLLTTS